jgi:hypothetical protein
MEEKATRVSLCLLDDLDMSDSLTLDDFQVRYYSPCELKGQLRRVEKESFCAEGPVQFERYAKFPWARLEQAIEVDTDRTKRRLSELELSWHHAGVPSWYPFTDLLRTLNLLKPTGGPVIARQFYSWIESPRGEGRCIDRVIYEEPQWDYDGPDGESVHPLMFAYKLEGSDAKEFSELRKQLAECIQVGNSHLQTAVHYFEKGDRGIVPVALPGSFNAIDPLMSYEAALEALFIGEEKGNGENKLSRRIAACMKEQTKVNADDVKNFVRRVFVLRSKVAHGAWPIEEIERLIVVKPNDEIRDLASKSPRTIKGGNYDRFLVQAGPHLVGFLMNLRELARLSTRFFCDEISAGRDKAETIRLLDKANSERT